jgi:transcriptional regulator with XRE-family HTH domain
MIEFGEYFRKLRTNKGLTQQQVAESIGKTTMLISGVEKGKNGSFQEEDLLKIAILMNLSQQETNELLWNAAKSRNQLPGYIVKSVCNHETIFEILNTLVCGNYNVKELKGIKEYITKVGEKKHV